MQSESKRFRKKRMRSLIENVRRADWKVNTKEVDFICFNCNLFNLLILFNLLYTRFVLQFFWISIFLDFLFVLFAFLFEAIKCWCWSQRYFTKIFILFVDWRFFLNYYYYQILITAILRTSKYLLIVKKSKTNE